MRHTPILILAPKAASTSLRAVLTVPVPKLANHRHIHLPLAHKFYQKRIREKPDAWLFGVVRHPLDRFMSAWAYFKHPRSRTVPENYVLEAVLQGGDVNDFVRMVDLGRLAKIIPHFQRQVVFFTPGETGRNADQMLRFESLVEDFRTLCRNLGMPEDTALVHKRASEHDRWEDALSADSVAMLRDFYQEDFAQYDYR